MEDFALDIMIGKGPAARSIRLKLPRFTVIGATTRLALVSAPLRARFGAVYRLDYYDLKAIENIVQRGAAKMSMEVDAGRLRRGSPPGARHAARGPAPAAARARLCPGARRRAWSPATWPTEALNLLNVDPLGLDEVDRRVLHTIIEKYNGGPVGLNTIAASIGEEPDTIMDVVEPYLLQLGFPRPHPAGTGRHPPRLRAPANRLSRRRQPPTRRLF